MGNDIGHLHHVGLVVGDLDQALARFRRLGFVLSPPTYPVMSPSEGAPPVPFGAANAHASFPRNFVELVGIVADRAAVPADAKRVALEVPASVLPRVLASIEETVDRLNSSLARFQGAHILVFEAPDVAAVARRFGREGIAHGEVQTVQRQVETPTGPRMVPVRVLEIAGERTPEGRLAVADGPPADVLRHRVGLDHPNGAIDLIEAVVCVGEADLDAVAHRYEAYTGRSARGGGSMQTLELDGARITIVADSHLEALLPGERPPALPAFVAYAVAVRDIDATMSFLQRNRVPAQPGAGGVFVPAAAALGAAVVFRQVR